MDFTLITDVDPTRIERELDRCWVEARRDGLGPEFPPADAGGLLDLERRDVLTVVPDSQGLDPATTALVVSFAPVAAKVARDLWSAFLLPSLKRRFGDDAVRGRSRDD